MARGTTLRNVRVTDELWERAKVVAAREETTVSQVIRWALENFVEDRERE